MTEYNYNLLKEIAKRKKWPVKDLLALSPQNDPFYAGTPSDHAKGEWFADIYQRAGYGPHRPPHLRRVHYWTVSQEPPVLMPDDQPYENTEKCWEFLIAAAKAARYLGLVPMAGIVDNKNPAPAALPYYVDPEPGFSIDVPDLNKIEVNLSGFSNANAQPYHIEVWCEKSTMNDVLVPICQRYHTALVTFEGEVSITAVCVNLIERIRQSGGKPTRIFYISDSDPAGNSMPAAMSRKLEYALRSEGLDYDVRVKPLALTPALIKQYKLPRIPIKETELRAARFEQAFGEGAVELDALEALHPGVLGKLVEDAFKIYWSQDDDERLRGNYFALKRKVQNKISEITARYGAEIAALETMFDEVRAVQDEINPEPYQVEAGEARVDEDGDWLFDSQRSYMKQIMYYKLHKGQLEAWAAGKIGDGDDTDG